MTKSPSLSKLNSEKPTDHCPICSSQEENVTSQILKTIQLKKFSKNVIIFDQEDEAQGIYLIHKGTVKISRLSSAGKEIIIEILGSGKTLGENSLFGHGKNSDTAMTAEQAEIFFIPKADFKQLLVENPQLYQSVIHSLTQWMDKLNSVIENINTASAKDRVSNYLLKIQKEQQRPLIHLTGKKHEVALMLGLRPETFSRALTDLEAEGSIKMNHKQIQILNLDKP